LARKKTRKAIARPLLHTPPVLVASSTGATSSNRSTRRAAGWGFNSVCCRLVRRLDHLCEQVHAELMASPFLVANLHLIGLDVDDPDTSLYLCVKELVENALTACDDGGQHSIKLSIVGVPTGGSPRLYHVTVSDDAGGFNERLTQEDAFPFGSGGRAGGSTPRGSAACDASFGRGLPALLLWANHSYWSGAADEHPSPGEVVEITSLSGGCMLKRAWSVDAEMLSGPVTATCIETLLASDSGSQVYTRRQAYSPAPPFSSHRPRPSHTRLNALALTACGLKDSARPPVCLPPVSENTRPNFLCPPFPIPSIAPDCKPPHPPLTPSPPHVSAFSDVRSRRSCAAAPWAWCGC